MDLKTLYDFAERYEQHLEEIVSLLKQNASAFRTL